MIKKKNIAILILSGIGMLIGQTQIFVMEYVPYNYKPCTKIEVLSNGNLIETSTSNAERNYFNQEKT